MASNQEQLALVLAENAQLREQLRRTDAHLVLLSDVNRQLTAAFSLDEILDAAPLLPQRLVAAQATALYLVDTPRPILARASDGAPSAMHEPPQSVMPHVLPELPQLLVLPLHDGQALIGWIDLYQAEQVAVRPDELALLETMCGEIAEAISGARRRAQEALAVYELERAISDERARIARDIHDGIAQTLAFRRMRIDLWLDWLTSEPERLRDEMLQLKQVLRDQIADLRRAIFSLRPIQFDELGFTAGLQRYVSEFAEQQGWQVDIDLSGVPAHFPAALEAVSFRIVQEALTNAAKHAEANAVVVAFTEAAGGAEITVRDNGCGFDPAQPTADAHQHVGLRQMRERLTGIGGRLVLDTAQGCGTVVRAWIPYSGT